MRDHKNDTKKDQHISDELINHLLTKDKQEIEKVIQIPHKYFLISAISSIPKYEKLFSSFI